MPFRSPLAVFIVIVISVVSGQSTPRAQSQPSSPDALWRRALDAWDAGQYPAAVRDLQAVMKSPAANDYFERAALLTGELYVTTELSTDGRNPRISSDGKIATFEIGAANEAVTRIDRLGATPQSIADVRAANVVIDPAGTRAAWIRNQGADGTDITRTRSGFRHRDKQPAGKNAGRRTRLVRRWTAAAVHRFRRSRAVRRLFCYGADEHSNRAARAADRRSRIQDEPRRRSVRDGRRLSAVAQSPFGGGGGGVRAGAPAAAPPAGGAGGAGAQAGGGGQPGGRAGAGGGRGAGGPGGPAGTTYVVMNLKTKATYTITGTGLTMSADGSTLAWMTRSADGLYTLQTSPAASNTPATIRTGRERIDAPALSPDGKPSRTSTMTNTDWEIYVSDGATQRRVTREIPHDLMPRFLPTPRCSG